MATYQNWEIYVHTHVYKWYEYIIIIICHCTVTRSRERERRTSTYSTASTATSLYRSATATQPSVLASAFSFPHLEFLFRLFSIGNRGVGGERESIARFCYLLHSSLPGIKSQTVPSLRSLAHWKDIFTMSTCTARNYIALYTPPASEYAQFYNVDSPDCLIA